MDYSIDIEGVKNAIIECTKTLWDEKLIMTNIYDKISKRFARQHELKTKIEDKVKSSYRRVAHVRLTI